MIDPHLFLDYALDRAPFLRPMHGALPWVGGYGLRCGLASALVAVLSRATELDGNVCIPLG